MFTATPTICVIGLGYVGLPLAIEFGKQLETIGFDINHKRIEQLRCGTDNTLELTSDEISSSHKLKLTSDPTGLVEANVYIVTVPTPVTSHRIPDLGPLKTASKLIGSVLSVGDIVIFESTTYPGCTEEVCVPILENISGLKFNKDFYAGYSPERINPGDKAHRLGNTIKITSGSTPEVADYVDKLYNQIVEAGTHKASSIKVAEAAKVIENTQRHINIALINEFALIFDRLGIDTQEVLSAAGTKWNFLNFKPGLVGGHCISVDPYYLTYKAQEAGYFPDVILSGLRINDKMGIYVADSVVKLMLKKQITVVDSRILILGLTFKENCPDLRDTRVIDIIRELETYHANVDVYDPWADPQESKAIYGVELVTSLRNGAYDAIVACVGHDEFSEMPPDKVRALGKQQSVLYDVKHIYPKNVADGRL